MMDEDEDDDERVPDKRFGVVFRDVVCSYQQQQLP